MGSGGDGRWDARAQSTLVPLPLPPSLHSLSTTSASPDLDLRPSTTLRLPQFIDA